MTIQQAAQRLNKRKLVLVAAVLVGAVLAMGGSLLRQLEYRTSSTFLVIQEQRFADPYTQARSAEYLAGLLARVVDTDTFRTTVFARTPDVQQYLPYGEQDLREEWGDSIEVRTVADTGILTVSAYHADPAAARALVDAIGATLTNDTGTYLGTSAPVKLLQIDGPVASQFPVRPNLAANIVAGALVGFAAGAGWVLLRRPRRDVLLSRIAPADVLVRP